MTNLNIINMKNLAILAILALAAFGCSKNDETPAPPPSLGEITLSKATIGVKQLIVATCATTGSDTLNVNYTWSATNGKVVSNGKRFCNWIPETKGAATLTLNIERNGTTVAKTITADVVNCDFEYGIWGDNGVDVIISEAANGSGAPTLNMVSGNILIMYKKSLYMYAYITSPSLIGGIKVTTSKYEFPNQSKYVDDYNQEVVELTKLYGVPVSNVTWNREPYTSKDVKNWGIEVSLGTLVLTSTFTSTKTKIVVTCKRDENGSTGTSSIYIPITSTKSNIQNLELIRKNEVAKLIRN